MLLVHIPETSQPMKVIEIIKGLFREAQEDSWKRHRLMFLIILILHVKPSLLRPEMSHLWLFLNGHNTELPDLLNLIRKILVVEHQVQK